MVILVQVGYTLFFPARGTRAAPPVIRALLCKFFSFAHFLLLRPDLSPFLLPALTFFLFSRDETI